MTHGLQEAFQSDHDSIVCRLLGISMWAPTSLTQSQLDFSRSVLLQLCFHLLYVHATSLADSAILPLLPRSVRPQTVRFIGVLLSATLTCSELVSSRRSPKTVTSIAVHVCTPRKRATNQILLQSFLMSNHLYKKI